MEEEKEFTGIERIHKWERSWRSSDFHTQPKNILEKVKQANVRYTGVAILSREKSRTINQKACFVNKISELVNVGK